jgi:hypothetical protein
MPYARLASDRWLTSIRWDLNPLDSIERFQLLHCFPLPQAYPGATQLFPLITALTSTHSKGRLSLEPQLTQS